MRHWLNNRYAWFVLISAATLAAYWNSFQGVWVLDDVTLQHTFIVTFWDHLIALVAIGHRRYLSLTYAFNEYMGGFEPFGWHVVNFIIHLASALLVFGIAHRALARSQHLRLRDAAVPLAGAVAVIFAVHPLQTESVTYIVQRAQSLMGLLTLLSLYALIRGFDSPRRWWWYAMALLSADLALETKPHMAVAPVLFLLFDRAFLSGSYKAIWRGNRGIYIALAALWIVVASGTLLLRTYQPDTIGAAGVTIHSTAEGALDGGAAVITPWEYARSQFGVICHYLRLIVWPDQLCLDYAWPIADTAQQIVLPAIIIVLLVGATLWACVRQPEWGLWGAWFFLFLAPVSTVLPRPDLCVEHRMYLPLLGPVWLLVVGGYALWTRMKEGTAFRIVRAAWMALVVGGILSFVALTARRNDDYGSATLMWSQTVRIRPQNARAHVNLANWLLRENGDPKLAIEHCRIALALKPDHLFAKALTAIAMVQLTLYDDAIQIFEAILPRFEKNLMVRSCYANALLETARFKGALEQFEIVLKQDPTYPAGILGLADADLRVLRPKAALKLLEDGMPYIAEIPDTYLKLGEAQLRLNRLDEAEANLRKALQMNPNLSEASRLLATIAKLRANTNP